MLDASNRYKTKAALKKPVDTFNKFKAGKITREEALAVKISGKPALTEKQLDSEGITLRYEETSIHNTEYKPTGKVQMVGPDAYRDRKWFATITLKDGYVIAVS